MPIVIATMSPRNEPITNRSLQGYHTKAITSICFHPQPSLLSTNRKPDAKQQFATSSLDGQVCLWNYSQKEKETRLYRFKGHSKPVQRVKYSLSGNLLASVSSDHTCRLWAPKPNSDSMVLQGHQGAVNDVDFGIGSSYDESLLLTCSNDKTLRVWNLSEQPSFEASLVGHTNWVTSCSFCPERNDTAASGSDDGTVRVWDIASSSNLITYSNADAVAAISFEPAGHLIAASLKNGTAVIYDLRTDETVHTFDNSSLHYSGGIAFHTNGHQCLMGHITFGDNVDLEGFSLYDIRNQERIFTVTNSEIPKNNRNSQMDHTCCSFSSDGSQFATAGNASTGTVKVWDYDYGRGPKNEDNIKANLTTPIFHNDIRRPTIGASDHSTGNMKKQTINCEITEEEKEHHVEERNDQPAVHLQENEHASPLLTHTLDNIMHLIESLTQTVVLLEKRVAAQEHLSRRLVTKIDHDVEK